MKTTSKGEFRTLSNIFPVDTECKLNVHKAFRRRPFWTSSERLMYVQFTSCVHWIWRNIFWRNFFHKKAVHRVRCCRVRDFLRVTNLTGPRGLELRFSYMQYSDLHLWVIRWSLGSAILSKFQPRRCSHRRCSVKISNLKNFAIFTGKHLHWSLFLKKLQPFSPDSNTDASL